MSSKIGEYELLKEIGSGSFARVFKARLENQVYAIKVILTARLDEKMKLNLEKECTIMRSVGTHPNLCYLHKTFADSTGKFTCLVTEYCSGGDLSQFIRQRGCIREDSAGPNAREFLYQIISGLKFLDSHKVIHRDLKPANILLSDRSIRPQLKLCDFGFATVLEELKLCYTPCGTPLYMAPEIFEMKDYNGSADIWSLGIVYFEMLAGHPPFRGGTTREVLAKIRSGDWATPEHISPESNALIGKMLVFAPEERLSLKELYTQVGVMVDQLRILDSQSTAITQLPLSCSPPTPLIAMDGGFPYIAAHESSSREAQWYRDSKGDSLPVRTHSADTVPCRRPNGSFNTSNGGSRGHVHTHQVGSSSRRSHSVNTASFSLNLTPPGSSATTHATASTSGGHSNPRLSASSSMSGIIFSSSSALGVIIKKVVDVFSAGPFEPRPPPLYARATRGRSASIDRSGNSSIGHLYSRSVTDDFIMIDPAQPGEGMGADSSSEVSCMARAAQLSFSARCGTKCALDVAQLEESKEEMHDEDGHGMEKQGVKAEDVVHKNE